MGTKTSSTAKRRSTPKASKTPAVRSSGRSVDARGRDVPFARDVEFVQKHELPPPTSERLMHAITDAFTGRVCATLQKKELVEFYGSRVKPSAILGDVELAVEATAVSARLAHGADLAAQIGAPALVRLMEVASLIVRDVDALVARHPGLADGLSDLTDWWAATFPGAGQRPSKDNGSGNSAQKDGSKSAGSGASGSGSSSGTQG